MSDNSPLREFWQAFDRPQPALSSPSCCRFHATRIEDQQEVLIELHQLFSPLPSSLSLPPAHPALQQIFAHHLLEDRLVLVLERPQGRPLYDYIEEHAPLPVQMFFPLALSLCEILSALHASSWIHRAVSPQAILLEHKTQQPRLRDLHHAILASLHCPTPVQEPAYAPPERLTHTTWEVSTQSDLYALGAVFYALLSGEPPFVHQASLSLLRATTTQEPLPLSARRSEIPVGLCKLVSSLLHKDPAQRYASTSQLLLDLQQMHDEHLEAFAQSSTQWVQAPDSQLQIFGRHLQLQALQEHLRYAQQTQPSVLLLQGEAGIGKSALIRSFQRSLPAPRVGVWTGTFRGQGSLPYRAFGQLLAAVAQEPSGAAFDAPKANAFREALAPFVQTLCAFVPSLFRLLGLPEAPPPEEPNYKELPFALQAFVQALCAQQSATVLILEDLHHASTKDIELLELLLDSPAQALLLIVSYRTPLKPFAALERLEQQRYVQGRPVYHIQLGPLDSESVQQMLRHVLPQTHNSIAELARWLSEKTGNKPLLLHQSLQCLLQQGLLWEVGGSWSWDLDAIKQAEIPDDLEGLFHTQLKALSYEGCRFLRFASCFVAPAAHTMLRPLVGFSHDEAADAIEEIVEAGLCVDSPTHLRFASPHVREQIYQTIPPEKRTLLHWRIGVYLCEHDFCSHDNEQLFATLAHLNKGRVHAQSADEQELIVWLNAAAAQRAAAEGAFLIAQQKLSVCFELVASKARQTPPANAFALLHLRLLCEGMQRRWDDAQNTREELLALEPSAFERALLLQTLAQAYTHHGRFEDAIQILCEGLDALDCKISLERKSSALLQELLRIRWKMRGKDDEALATITPPLEPTLQATAALLAQLLRVAQLAKRDSLYATTGLKLLALSLDHGNGAFSSLAYICYSSLQRPLFNDFDKELRFAQLALSLAQQSKVPQPSVLYSYATHIQPWHEARQEAPALLQKAASFAAHAGMLHLRSKILAQRAMYAVDHHLSDAIQQTKHALRHIEKAGKDESWWNTKLQLQFLRSLRGLTHQPLSLNDASFDELKGTEAETPPQSPHYQALYHLCKLQLLFLHQEPDAAQHHLSGANKYGYALQHSIAGIQLAFFGALIATARLPQLPPAQKRNAWQQFKQQHKLIRSWSARCPQNFQHLLTLLDAEQARCNENPQKATELYALAIEHAQAATRYERALIHECAARYHIQQGPPMLAQAYLQQALALYQAWGAHAKSAHLQQTYPSLQQTPAPEPPRSRPSPAPLAFDIALLTQAFHSISHEHTPQEVIEKLMQICLESVGAERGLLLLKHQDGWCIECETNRSLHTAHFTPALPLEEGELLLPIPIIRQALQLQRALVLNDFSEAPSLALPYLQQHHIRSLTCVPIHKQNLLVGLLYLEHRLIPHVCTPSQLQTLEILAAHATSSLESAKLHQRLEEQGEQWRKILHHSPDFIMSIDRAHRIDFINRLQPGFTMEEVIGQKVEDFMVSEHANLLHDAIEDAFQLKKQSQYEFSAPNPDGELRFYICRIVPVQHQHSTSQVILIANDITQFKQVEERRLSLRARLLQRQKLDSISTLASGVAHEINNPIQGILGYAELLETRIQEPSLKTFASHIIEETERISKLVHNLLAFAREEHSHKGAIHIPELLEIVCSLLHAVFRKDHILLQREIDQTLPPIRGQSQQLQQALMNLLTNARDALNLRYPRPDPDKTLRLQASVEELEQRWVKIIVEDHGVGISSEDVDRIFDPFFTTKERNKHVGLGLSVAHGIVSDHGGSLSVESTPDSHTRFTLELPVEPEEPL